MKRLLRFVIASTLFSIPVSYAAQAGSVIVGVNVTNNDGTVSQEFQDDEIKHLAENGVKTIRTALVSYNIDFIIKAYQHGISSVVVVFPFRGTKSWSHVTLSQISSQEFTEKFKPMLDKLEAAGVRLEAFELGNEINTPRFNSDLPDGGGGRELRLADLNNSRDPQASLVAKGYRAYLQVLATLKDLRDHSKLNQHTPIISAGLAQRLGPSVYETNLRDTVEFFRQNGIDKLVDGYGVHVYPSSDPNRPVQERIASLEEDIFSACRSDKPCWMTEWGFGNSDQSCPPKNEKALAKVVQDMRTFF